MIDQLHDQDDNDIARDPHDAGEDRGARPRRDRGMILAIAAAVVCLAAIGIGSAVTNRSDSNRLQNDDTASTYSDDYSAETTTTIDACHDKAASIIGDLDNGATAVQVYADYGGTQDPQTQAFIRLYYQFQSRAVQVGADSAIDELANAIDAACP